MIPLLRVIQWLPHVVMTALMIVAMVDMLVGVFLRYVMTWVSATFDLPSVRFFWVEEIGEYSLAWLTFIGAAIGIRRRHGKFDDSLLLDRPEHVDVLRRHAEPQVRARGNLQCAAAARLMFLRSRAGDVPPPIRVERKVVDEHLPIVRAGARGVHPNDAVAGEPGEE